MCASHCFVVLLLALVLLLASGSIHSASAATTLTVYQSQHSVTLDGVVQPGESTDTSPFAEPISGLTVGFKQNGTGLLILMTWQESAQCNTCYAAIEFGAPSENNMGSSSSPYVMILVSQSFKGYVREAIAIGQQAPTYVDQYGYRTQSVAGLSYSKGTYTAELYRPFALSGASPYDQNLTLSSTIGIGFAVGDFSAPGTHTATDMSTYTLTITSQTYAQTTTQTSTPTQPVQKVSLYDVVRQYGPYLPLVTIVIIAIHFVRRKVWTGESPW